jgi:hypothetical protein
VWNEPNLQGPEGFYNGTPEQLAILANATAEVLAESRFSNLSVLLLNPPMAGLGADAVDQLTRYFVECRRLGVVHTGVAWHSYNLPAGTRHVTLFSMQVTTLSTVAYAAGSAGHGSWCAPEAKTKNNMRSCL